MDHRVQENVQPASEIFEPKSYFEQNSKKKTSTITTMPILR